MRAFYLVYLFVLKFLGIVGFEPSDVELTQTPENATINENTNLIILIHGWLSNSDAVWYTNLTNAYLAQDRNAVLIHVDWSSIASNPLYIPPAAACQDVGYYLADYLIELNANTSVQFANIHIVGHSLGSHVGGNTGFRITSETNKTIGRITALDAASPLFSTLTIPIFRALQKTDADMVVAIHTDGGVIGIWESFAVADIFPNGGIPPQPGCPDIVPGRFSVSCSHNRAYYYFVEAVKYGNYIATNCTDYDAYKAHECDNNAQVNMANVPIGTTGLFFLTTGPSPPFLKRNTTTN